MKYAKILFSCALMLILSCHLASAWDLTGIMREWSIGTELKPYDIKTLSDGSVWATHDDHGRGAGKVFTINLSDGSPVQFTAPLPAQFNTMDRASDDTLWIADDHDRIWKFNPYAPAAEAFTAYTLPGAKFTLPAQPYGVKVGPDGKIWFTCQNNPAIGSFDPATGSWEAFPIPSADPCTSPDVNCTPGAPVQLAFGHDGKVVFTIREWGPNQGAGVGHLFPADGCYDVGAAGCTWIEKGHINIWTNPGLFFPETIPPTTRLRTPWEIIMTQYDPDTFWFSDKTANLLIRVNLDPGATLITRFPTPAEITDSHFFAVDPDGIFWLAGYGSRRIGIFNPLTYTFDSTPLITGGSPMGLSISPVGEVWWASTDTGGAAGIGRFIPFIDSDGDGIDDSIDRDPAVPSNDFSDGTTAGTITDRGDQILTITEATDPFGVRIIASPSGGESLAHVLACVSDIRDIRLSASDEALVTCGSATIQVLVGPVEVELGNGSILTIPGGSKATVRKIADGLFQVENSGRSGTITVGSRTLKPGRSIRLGILRLGVDIKPGSCHNPLNVDGKGVMPVAIVGSRNIDVKDIDVSTLELRRRGREQVVRPLRFHYEDVVATPFRRTHWGCHEVKADGYEDLFLSFETRAVVRAMGNLKDGDVVFLTVTGKFSDGIDFVGSDWVKIIKKKKER